MTATTTVASGIGVGAYDVALAAGVEHMGRHPMGEGRPEPRFLAEKIVDPEALLMGKTAENLHDRFPQLTKERGRRLRRRLPGEDREGLRGRQDPARPGAGGAAPPSTAGAWRLPTSRPPGHLRWSRWQVEDPFRPHGRSPPATPRASTTVRPPRFSPLEEVADELGLNKKMRMVSYAFAGVEPEVMGYGPVPATEKARQKAGLSIDDIGLFEINEAFAVQV